MRASCLLLIALVLTSSDLFADDNLDESKAIEKIELLGGKVWRDKKLPGRPVVEVDFRKSERFNEKYLHLLRGFSKLTSLNLIGKTITDIGLKEISNLGSLTELWLHKDQIPAEAMKRINESLPNTKVNVWRGTTISFVGESVQPGLAMFVIAGPLPVPSDPDDIALIESDNIMDVDFNGTNINDDDLWKLRKVENLTTLGLNGTEIGDNGLTYIAELSKLTTLSLARTRITDAGMKEFNELTLLTKLDLSDTKITDDGLKVLDKLKNLSRLDLRGTKTTNAGVKQLQKSLPNTNIINDE